MFSKTNSIPEPVIVCHIPFCQIRKPSLKEVASLRKGIDDFRGRYLQKIDIKVKQKRNISLKGFICVWGKLFLRKSLWFKREGLFSTFANLFRTEIRKNLALGALSGETVSVFRDGLHRPVALFL